jgi:hypothetical protein
MVVWGGARSDLTFRASVRAVGPAKLLVATLMFVEFSAIALVDHDSKAFRFGLWMMPMTLVVWGTAALLYVLELAPRGLRALGRRLAGQPRSSLSAGSEVWDDWRDSPEWQDR